MESIKKIIAGFMVVLALTVWGCRTRNAGSPTTVNFLPTCFPSGAQATLTNADRAIDILMIDVRNANEGRIVLGRFTPKKSTFTPTFYVNQFRSAEDCASTVKAFACPKPFKTPLMLSRFTSALVFATPEQQTEVDTFVDLLSESLRRDGVGFLWVKPPGVVIWSSSLMVH